MISKNFAVNVISSPELIARTRKVLDSARSKNIPVFHVIFEMKKEFPHEKNKTMQMMKSFFGGAGAGEKDSLFWAINETLKPLAGGIMERNYMILFKLTHQSNIQL